MAAFKEFVICVTEMYEKMVNKEYDQYDFVAAMGGEYYEAMVDGDGMAFFNAFQAGLMGEGDQEVFKGLLCSLFDSSVYNQEEVQKEIKSRLNEAEEGHFRQVVKEAAQDLIKMDPEEFDDKEWYPHLAELASAAA